MNLIPLNKSCDYDFPDKLKITTSLGLFADYYSEYFGNDYVPLDILIEKEGSILGLVQCSRYNQALSLPDGGIIITLFKPEYYKDKKLIAELIDALYSIAVEKKCISVSIRDHFIDGDISALGECLLNKKFMNRQTFAMNVNLDSFSPQEYRKGVRKSYKSLINWGANNLEIKRINKDSDDELLLLEFKEFHCKISGRQTRSDLTWRLQYEMAKAGLGEMSLAYLNEDLVAASFFADYAYTTVYFTGVYERDLFDKGLSHFMVYDGICQSNLRGNCGQLTLGYFETQEKDPKISNIQFFKKGFAQKMEPVIFWTKELE